tara:strand:- start:453 stop:1181 length:729 start_codon:yes stop_codon:yes gene_type:complete
MRNVLIIGLALIAGIVVLNRGPQAADTVSSPVVVELFTSQGCSSCPPAEAFLVDLAKRRDVIALEFHVSYWDYIGWKDPFAKREYTQRQRSYVKALGGRSLYTPQMVIAGQEHAVGSHRSRVNRSIENFSGTNPKAPKLSLSKPAKGQLKIDIGAGEADGQYDVIFVTYDKPHITQVTRGENEGRKLINANVVRSMQQVANWNGQALSKVISVGSKAGNGGCAVLIQKRNHGPIVAAAQLQF